MNNTEQNKICYNTKVIQKSIFACKNLYKILFFHTHYALA